jgi:DNA-binding transcriptional LysR family regulator
MHNRENWDDLRYVLAVADCGSVSAAARELGVNHATVLRRVAAFEQHHGLEVFEKSARGYSIAEHARRLIDAARDVDLAVQAVDRVVRGAQQPLGGVIRVTSTDTFCTVVLPHILGRIAKRAGGLRIDILSTNAHVDLARLQADLTIRPTNQLPDDLVGERAGDLGFDLYATPDCPPDRWIGLSGALSRSVVAAWMAANLTEPMTSGSTDSFITAQQMARLGIGQAILPCVLGDADPSLERRRDKVPALSVGIWVASHTDLADVPRISAVRRLLVAEMRGMAAALAGGPI